MAATVGGKLAPSPGRTTNRYRDYDEADAERLRLLIGLRQLDIPLDQAAELASMCAAGRCDEVSDELRALLAEKRQELARRWPRCGTWTGGWHASLANWRPAVHLERSSISERRTSMPLHCDDCCCEHHCCGCGTK